MPLTRRTRKRLGRGNKAGRLPGYLLDDAVQGAFRPPVLSARQADLAIRLQLQALRKVDELTPEARATGCVNTTFFRPSPTSSSTLVHVGTNTDAAAVSNVLLSSFLGVSSPLLASAPRQFQPGNAGAFVVGGGGATRAAIYALSRLNLSPIFIVNRDPSETERVVQSFPDIDLRPLTTIEQARREMEDLRKRGVRLVCGVSAIPCEPPTSEGEKRVYEVANEVFALAGGKGPEMERMERHEGCLPLPMKPVFVGAFISSSPQRATGDEDCPDRHGVQAAHDNASDTGRRARLDDRLRYRGGTREPASRLHPRDHKAADSRERSRSRRTASVRSLAPSPSLNVIDRFSLANTEHCKLWTGIDVPSEVRDSARALLAE